MTCHPQMCPLQTMSVNLFLSTPQHIRARNLLRSRLWAPWQVHWTYHITRHRTWRLRGNEASLRLRIPRPSPAHLDKNHLQHAHHQLWRLRSRQAQTTFPAKHMSLPHHRHYPLPKKAIHYTRLPGYFRNGLIFTILPFLVSRSSTSSLI